ncbi:hypothetical protein KC19_2G035900 [Ceratodon purpureus]|uniref:Uncharacterized protein n=1 Tax=Ceratodon purpureus TaxID=3225 RepID=A0A8T0IRT5_CERPU|nr:hypothetical protein KC19_2G035900 [Ceratodon purpureus]
MLTSPATTSGTPTRLRNLQRRSGYILTLSTQHAIHASIARFKQRQLQFQTQPKQSSRLIPAIPQTSSASPSRINTRIQAPPIRTTLPRAPGSTPPRKSKP